MFTNKKIILASNSHSRKSMLKNNNIKFITTSHKCDEGLIKKKIIKKGAPLKNIPYFIAKEKVKSIKKNNKNKIIIGSDTIIEFNGKILNKAKNLKEAYKKIKKLSGKKHKIYSSAVAFYNNKIVWRATQKSTVKIRKLTNKEIKKYIKQNRSDIIQSVGCYKIEGSGPNIIENIKGDFYNVMGFPLFPFLLFLKRFKKKQ